MDPAALALVQPGNASWINHGSRGRAREAESERKNHQLTWSWSSRVTCRQILLSIGTVGCTVELRILENATPSREGRRLNSQ